MLCRILGRAFECWGEGLIQERAQLNCEFEWRASCVVELIATLDHGGIGVVKFISLVVLLKRCFSINAALKDQTLVWLCQLKILVLLIWSIRC